MLTFKPVPLRLGQAVATIPAAVPPAAPTSIMSRKTIPLVLTGVSTVLTAAAAYGASDRKTEGQKNIFMLTSAALALSAAAFLFFVIAPENPPVNVPLFP